MTSHYHNAMIHWNKKSIIAVVLLFPLLALSQDIVTRNKTKEESQNPSVTSQTQQKRKENKQKTTGSNQKKAAASGLSQEKREQIISDLDKNMVFVQGGVFQMGANDLNHTRHQVEVDDFYIGKFEVTSQEWYAVTGKRFPSSWEERNTPAVSLEWEDVEEFISVLNAKTNKAYRLPTEAEWEWAAQGGNRSRNYTYCGSNDLKEVVAQGCCDVGTKKPNELGLYDMSGNVNELCSDYYGFFFSKAEINPTGPKVQDAQKDDKGQYFHVVKGGAWSPQYVADRFKEYRPQFRVRSVPNGMDIGIRLVLDAYPSDIPKEMQPVFRKAKFGDTEAVREMANFYRQRNNNSQYVKWLERGASFGDSDSYIGLGEAYKDGVGVEKDLMKAEEYLSTAFKSGNDKSRSPLAEVRYEIGLLLNKTKQTESLKWLEKSAEFGHPGAQNEVGKYYWHVENYKKAVEYFEKSANQGNSHAMHNLGNAYYKGLGIGKNLDKAAYWYGKAAEKGNQNAYKMLESLKQRAINIIDEKDAEPLIGCIVQHLRDGSTLNSMTSDVYGNCKLWDVQSGDVLRISLIGYKTKEITLKNPSLPESLVIPLSQGNYKKTEYHSL